jgi:hypothetical protein
MKVKGVDLLGGFTTCAAKHPPLPLGEGLVVYGGSCLSPVITDADIYVGFDAGMRLENLTWPWEKKKGILFPIHDGGVPRTDDADNLINYLTEQILSGKKVHLGCIGGHGRTGLVLALLVKKILGDVNAITYVRDFYCKKAVETQKQVEWLSKNFGILPAQPSHYEKGSYKGKKQKTDYYSFLEDFPPSDRGETKISDEKKAPANKKGNKTIIRAAMSPLYLFDN